MTCSAYSAVVYSCVRFQMFSMTAEYHIVSRRALVFVVQCERETGQKDRTQVNRAANALLLVICKLQLPIDTSIWYTLKQAELHIDSRHL